MSATGQNKTEDKAACLYMGRGENRLHEALHQPISKPKTENLISKGSITLQFLSNSCLSLQISVSIIQIKKLLEVQCFLRLEAAHSVVSGQLDGTALLLQGHLGWGWLPDRWVPGINLTQPGSASSSDVIFSRTGSLHTTQPHHSRKRRKALSAEN